MNKKILDALEVCLQALEKGETLEAVLGRYPHLVADLRPRLEAAQAARLVRTGSGQAANRLPIPQTAQSRSRSRVLAAAARLRESRTPRLQMGRTLRVVYVTLVVVAFIALSGNGLLTASASSLPGDILYPLKRMVENTQITFASNPTQRKELLDEFNQRRVQEAETLIWEGRVELVKFGGLITAKIPNGWMMDDISVIVMPKTQVNGTIATGVEVIVIGETRANGSVWASELTVEGSYVNPNNEPDDDSISSDSESTQTDTPEPTELHGDDHKDTPTPEVTISHQEDEDDAIQTPEPDEVHGLVDSDD
jgi:hypothetical protein